VVRAAKCRIKNGHCRISFDLRIPMYSASRIGIEVVNFELH